MLPPPPPRAARHATSLPCHIYRFDSRVHVHFVHTQIPHTEISSPCPVWCSFNFSFEHSRVWSSSSRRRQISNVNFIIVINNCRRRRKQSSSSSPSPPHRVAYIENWRGFDPWALFCKTGFIGPNSLVSIYYVCSGVVYTIFRRRCNQKKKKRHSFFLHACSVYYAYSNKYIIYLHGCINVVRALE